MTRTLAYLIVGAAGFLVQIVALTVLTMLACPYLPATAVAVELAVLHNFVWHERWTWGDRTAGRSGTLRRLVCYNASTGLTSIAGNVVLAAVYVGLLHVGPLMGNILAVCTLGLANFLISDRWVFDPA